MDAYQRLQNLYHTTLRDRITRPASKNDDPLTSRWKLAANTQQKSHFVDRLPLEIRLLIYQYLFPALGETLHIVEMERDRQGQQRLVHAKCLVGCVAVGDEHRIGPSYNSWGNLHGPCRFGLQACIQSGGAKRSWLPLMLSCQRLHKELVVHVCASIAFSLVGITGIDRFLSTVPPAGLSAIRRLHLSWNISAPVYRTRDAANAVSVEMRWRLALQATAKQWEAKWEKAWRVISNMAGLEDLRVTLFDWAYHPPEYVLLAPLRDITVEHFLVELPWVSAEEDHFPGSFRVSRPAASKKTAWYDGLDIWGGPHRRGLTTRLYSLMHSR